VHTVSSFAAVGGPPYRYTFLLVVANSYVDSVREELDRQAQAFADDLEGRALLAQSLPAQARRTAREVVEKPWPPALAERMDDESNPFIVVIDQAFRDFDPREHAYAVVWLSDFYEDPNAVRPLLQTLARKTKKSEDVIEYLRGVAEKAQAADAVGLASRVAGYVQIKPSVFGVSIDLKAILADIAARVRA
jgi:hypothetical protein